MKLAMSGVYSKVMQHLWNARIIPSPSDDDLLITTTLKPFCLWIWLLVILKSLTTLAYWQDSTLLSPKPTSETKTNQNWPLFSLLCPRNHPVKQWNFTNFSVIILMAWYFMVSTKFLPLYYEVTIWFWQVMCWFLLLHD